MSEKEIAEQAEKMWLEYHGYYPPEMIPAMPPVYLRAFRDAVRWMSGRENGGIARG